MTFDEACKIADEYYRVSEGVTIKSAVDLGEKWLFYKNKSEIQFGSMNITVSKNDGAISHFILPNKENFELLSKAVEMKLPETYLK